MRTLSSGKSAKELARKLGWESLESARLEATLRAGTMACSSNLAKSDRVFGEPVKMGTDRNALGELMH